MKTSDKFVWSSLGFLFLVLLGWYKVEKWYQTEKGIGEAGMDDPPSLYL